MKTQEPVIVCECGEILSACENSENIHRYKCSCGKGYKLIIKTKENL